MILENSTDQISIVVHGGAWGIPDEEKEGCLAGVRTACQIGYDILKSPTGTAIEAAQLAIESMELDPIFECARGSSLNASGYLELDALIADGKFNIGAVAGIRNHLHPIRIARGVRDKTSHILLTGQGANEFANLIGEKEVPNSELVVGRGKQMVEKMKNNGNADNLNGLRSDFDNVKLDSFSKIKGQPAVDFPSDTVGVVCRDRHGNVAVALSTGGVPQKLAGRVGDTPLWGAGGYADGHFAAASTGYGEDLIKAVMAKSVVDRLQQCEPSQKSAQECALKQVEHFGSKFNGKGGIISIDSQGNPGIAFNTPRMAFAYRVEGDPRGCVAGIEQEDIPKY
ncbi:Isoaspartyl peptidase/L-asparaginase [Smittium culicis]|uniref:beta-aspartyl-peptidase n=1 Tax=Smittium culicis TaxID=133412 RepID=A0A1R1X1T6_9FUNG|nr:Isoaspartyl peptidase/L-asparaginase [Smittium culicis]